MRVLDTDVCVELLRGNRAILTRRAATIDDVATTWMTASELYYGAERSRAPDANRSAVADFLATVPVLDHDLRAAQCFGSLKASLERGGARLADADLLIASLALARDAVLVTGNVRHYARIPDLRIENWLR